MTAADYTLAGAAPAPSLSSDVVRTAGLSVVVWLYLLSIAIPIGFDIGTLNMSLMRVLLLIVTMPLAAMLFMGRFGKVMLTDWLFFAHIFWATVAMAINNPDKVVENMGSTGIEFLGGYLIGRAFIRTPGQFSALCRAIVYLVCASLPFAIMESQTGRPVILDFLNSIPGVHSNDNVYHDPRMGLERVQVVFAHMIHYGLFSSVAFSLCFVALKGETSTFLRYLLSAMIGICVFLSLSSGALLALILQLGLIGWAFLFRNNTKRWWLLVGLFAVVYVAIDLASNRTPIKVFMSYATFSSHNAYWRGIIFEYGMQNVWANPVFGLGLKQWFRPSYMSSGSMDNFWLVMAVRFGIPGFLLLAIGYAWALWRVGRRDFSGSPRLTQYRLAWMFTFLGLSFTLSTVHIWTAIYSFVFMMLGAGMWLATYTPEGARQVDVARSSDDPRAHRPGIALTRAIAGVGLDRRSASPALVRSRPVVPEARSVPAAAPAADRETPRFTRFTVGTADRAAQAYRRQDPEKSG
jgi:hypothetical protein